MDKFIIQGGHKLHGEVTISGAKNALLALMPASLLAKGKYVFSNAPKLGDISTMSKLLETMGVETSHKNSELSLDTTNLNKYEAPYEHVKKMRASIYVLGPLLSRYGYAKVSLPGGCAWGPRPVNLHIEGMRKLGAEINLEEGYIIASAKRLVGTKIVFDVSSVGATGNILMAAVLAKGTTVIENAALEPEITALAKFLNTMGAKISGIGTTHLEIEGVDDLKPCSVSTIPDRIEAATFLCAVAISGGEVVLKNVLPEHFSAVLTKLEECGVAFLLKDDTIKITSDGKIQPVNVTTSVFPGFPTDVQAQWIALMTKSSGTAYIEDKIYLDRFTHVAELVRLGADITMKDNVAIVKGVKTLKGAKVMSTDLRASASLILAGLAGEGTTEVLRVYHLDRGYDAIEKKLQKLGAKIERVAGKEF
ncbi:MAG: UDP-N-acetylglucosamine 1-carboxyvinyltransferase [Ignavibacteriales bacterium]|nr:UDP-N-acetylglucosamine 1-carboxyvinyltransferase [Ignavibacteriales bacterium]